MHIDVSGAAVLRRSEYLTRHAELADDRIVAAGARLARKRAASCDYATNDVRAIRRAVRDPVPLLPSARPGAVPNCLYQSTLPSILTFMAKKS